MKQIICINLLLLGIFITGCSHKGIYSKGYYSGRSHQWPNGIHVVQAGETLYSIAFQYGHDYREVAVWNGISSPYTIFPEQQLKIVKPEHSRFRSATDVTNVNKTAKQTPADNSYKKPPIKTVHKTRTGSRKLRWRWPSQGPILSRFSATDPGQKGIEIAGQNGAPIYAAEAGYVVYSGSGLRGYGKLIIIKHDETFLSAYAHNNKLRVREGERVKKGERIADMGSTGTDKVKLHFEIRRNGSPVNPFKYLPKR